MTFTARALAEQVRDFCDEYDPDVVAYNEAMAGVIPSSPEELRQWDDAQNDPQESDADAEVGQ